MSEVVEGTATDLPVEDPAAKPAGPGIPDAPQDVITPEEEAPAEKELDLVVVVVKYEGGQIAVDGVSVQGDIRATEVQTLLELALPYWREKIGLSKG